MRLPLQITFRNTDPSPVIEEIVRVKASHLDRFCDDVSSCQVVIDVPHRHHRSGNRYRLRLDITVPGDEFAITRGASETPEGKNLTAAVREAFDTAARLLEDYVRRRRHANEVPRRDAPRQGAGRDGRA
jgi:ribosome-associated translation inhibitor RaiA